MNEDNLYNINVSFSLIPTTELNNLKLDNEQLKKRILELLKDKDFLQTQKTFFLKK